MQPTMIPADEIPADAHTVVVGPPNGDMTGDVRAIEMMVRPCQVNGETGWVYSARFVLSEEEREALAAGAPVWLSMFTGVYPFDLQIGALT